MGACIQSPKVGVQQIQCKFSWKDSSPMLLCLAAFSMLMDGKRPQGLWVQMHRLLRRICCGGVRQHHLESKRPHPSCPPFHVCFSCSFSLHMCSFSSWVWIVRLQISFDVIGFEELAFLILRFVLALAFCDLAFLLRPSLLYQRSVKRRHHWACPMCLCGTLRWSGGGGVVEGLLPSWKFHF